FYRTLGDEPAREVASIASFGFVEDPAEILDFARIERDAGHATAVPLFWPIECFGGDVDGEERDAVQPRFVGRGDRVRQGAEVATLNDAARGYIETRTGSS